MLFLLYSSEIKIKHQSVKALTRVYQLSVGAEEAELIVASSSFSELSSVRRAALIYLMDTNSYLDFFLNEPLNDNCGVVLYYREYL